MEHKFNPSLTDDKICVTCKRIQRDHTIIAQCEACPKVGPCEIFADMLLCKKCYADEVKAVHDYQAPDLQEQRLVQHKNETINLIQEANKIDQSIDLSQKIFNAKTVAHVEVMKAIDSDESITNKPYARAEFSVNRVKTLQKTIFDLREALIDAQNEQRAIQVYLNEMSNQLREQERAELKIADITYLQDQPKVKKEKSTATKKANKSVVVDMAEVNFWAAKIGQSGNAIHMIMISQGMTAEKAARHLGKLLGKVIED